MICNGLLFFTSSRRWARLVASSTTLSLQSGCMMRSIINVWCLLSLGSWHSSLLELDLLHFSRVQELGPLLDWELPKPWLLRLEWVFWVGKFFKLSQWWLAWLFLYSWGSNWKKQSKCNKMSRNLWKGLRKCLLEGNTSGKELCPFTNGFMSWMKYSNVRTEYAGLEPLLTLPKHTTSPATSKPSKSKDPIRT